jgi:triacylglycerol lipase
MPQNLTTIETRAESIAASDSKTSTEVVILLHGLCGHWLVMSPLARRMRSAGYRTINWGYRSLTKDIQHHASRLRAKIEDTACDAVVSRIHIIAHSLGSIIVRQALSHGNLAKLGRIVMIGPPNHGSHVATRAEPIFGRLSHTLSQISDRPGSWVNQLECDLGKRAEVGVIIAGGDLVVARESTEFPNASDTIEIAGMHSGVLFKRSTARAVVHFLKQGKF